jgi:hypothetical protein
VVVGRAETVPLASDEAKDANFIFLKLRELEWINAELEQDIVGLNLNRRKWSIGLSIPTIVELLKRRFHINGTRTVAAARRQLRRS